MRPNKPDTPHAAMRTQTQDRRQRRGFTEAKFTVVKAACIVAIVAIVVIVLMPRPGPHRTLRAHFTASESQISAFAGILETFRVDNGSYPSGTNGLQDLLRQPATATNWHGPYIKDITKDPWDREYVYDFPGKHTESGYAYDLYSLGPPRENHPIANWTRVDLKTGTNRRPGR
jgi:general secretion pathway protein G